jgi:hypothetical protein
MKALIDEQGRVELADLVQSQLGVRPGDMLSLDERDGKWFLQPIPRTARTAAESSCFQRQSEALCPSNDLNFENCEELDCAPVRVKPVATVTMRVEQAGRAKPMSHELDEDSRLRARSGESGTKRDSLPSRRGLPVDSSRCRGQESLRGLMLLGPSQ